ncbi:hypothetical protein PR202_ga29504 [Eleusine coracana subsp. coracana]|uniref:Uncharacterized protein n=1 Tax=Eleusine coracana subsp. coracana TaxID=191504 RepID=A0AAV5DK58_ELECO|nr:hypothetical protein PR202_ga29504 [Eleusine coracana subsp. coracana]
MAASGSGGEAIRPWTATSTWAPAGGAAVEDAVSFETSDEDAEESPAGVVLIRPDSDEEGDAPPCEVTESPNNTSESKERNVAGTCQDNNLAHYEATAEMTDVSPCVSLTVRLLSLQSKTSVHIEEIYIFADPVESTNDDSVTGPGNMGGSSLLAMLVPGLMQMSKSRNYKIDDGYFSHGSSNQPTHDHEAKESNPHEKVAHETGPCVSDDSKCKSAGIGKGTDFADGGAVSNEKSNQAQLPFKDPMSVQLPVQTTENTRAPSVRDQLVSNTDQLASSPMNAILTPYNHIERKLDTLLSKVEKMELYCSRFEDIMIKPLGSIEARLQRLEQQFDTFSVDIQSLRDSSARMSAPDGPSDTNSQEKVHTDGKARSPPDRKPGLFIRAPDFSSEDSCSYNISDGNQVNFHGPNVVPRLLVKVPEFISQPELAGEKLHKGPVSPVDCAQSSEQKEHKTSPGLVVKVPEFPDGDDEIEEEKKTEVGDCDDHTRDNTLCRNTVDSSEGKNRVSVNGALASALEALLMSTKGTSSPRSVVFPARSVSDETTNESSSCALSPENVDEMSTKDGSVDQIPGSTGNANLDGMFISCQDIDGAPNTSLSKPVLDSKVDLNEKNNHLDSDKEAFVASTVSLGVPLQHYIAKESIDDVSCINDQNNGPKLDAIPFITSTEPLDPPLPPAACESVDNGAQVNENRPAISLAEFLVARNSHSCKNGTSEVCCSTNGAEILSFEWTSSKAGKNSKNISPLLVKKALEIDGKDECVSSVTVGTTSEGSSYAAPSYVFKQHSINRIETLSDKDCGLENTENSAIFYVGLNSIYSQSSAPGSQEKLAEDSSFDWSVDYSISKSNGEDSWSDLTGMESFSGARASQPIVSENTAAGKCVENLLAGIGVSSTVTPVAGEELQKVCDLLYEYEDDIPGMTSTEKRTSKSSPSLEVLLAESSDSEVQISDDDAGIGSAQLFGSFSSDDSASVTTEPLVDVADLTRESEAYAAALNEPLTDVFGLPVETFADWSSGEHPNSLI